ncbi:MAG: nuclear transport factor 2 family protein, partial [Ferruginibacter sp.]|nr:nuclear transport factor 2 family protein [Cytophagales bacterium]
MKLLTAFFRMLLDPPVPTLLEDLHAQLLKDWIMKPDVDFLHPQCTWMLADGHPHRDCYRSSDFYNWYTDLLSVMYPTWNEVVSEVIGSAIGGIVVGEY